MKVVLTPRNLKSNSRKIHNLKSGNENALYLLRFYILLIIAHIVKLKMGKVLLITTHWLSFALFVAVSRCVTYERIFLQTLRDRKLIDIKIQKN